MRIATIFVLVFMTVSMTWAADALAEEEVYRWVDEDGVVHFGDRPPANTAAESVAIPQSAGVSAQPSPSSSVDSDSPESSAEPQTSFAQQQRDLRAKNRAEAEEKEKVIAAGCKKSRLLVSQLEPSTRVMVEMEDGTVTRLDDNVRLEKLNQAKSFIADYCND